MFLKRWSPDSLERVERRLRVFEEEYSLWDTALGLLEMGNVSATAGQFKKGLAAYLRSISLFDELGDLRWQARVRLRLAMAYSTIVEAFDLLAKAIELFEKIGDVGMLAEAHGSLAILIEAEGDLEKAVSESLKALEYSEKTDSSWGLSIACSNLVRQYAKLGDQVHAEEYFKKLVNLPQDMLSPLGQKSLSLAVFFAGKNLWKESDQHFKEHFEKRGGRLDLWGMMNYAWALERQGETVEAKEKREEINKITERFKMKSAHVNMEAYLMSPWKVITGEEFELRLDLVNASRSPGLLVEAEDLVPSDFEVTALMDHFSLENGAVEMKKRRINAFQVETVKLKVKTSKPAVYTINPNVHYIDEMGEKKNSKPNSITITVQAAEPKYEALPGRIPTGYVELDASLLGGLPERYAVALTAPSTDERQQLIRRFLEAGANAGEISFHVTADAANTKILAEKYPLNFYLFVCNPQVDSMIQNTPNTFKLKGTENLTEIDIAITKAFRTLTLADPKLKRACIEILSDVLLQHHASVTRKWLSELLPILKSKGFTILAVIDPGMHTAEETQAVLNLFDGEMRISEKETPKGTKQTLKIKRMRGQKYLENELTLNKETLPP